MSEIAVDLSTMPDHHYKNKKHVVLDLIDDTVRSHTQSEETFVPA